VGILGAPSETRAPANSLVVVGVYNVAQSLAKLIEGERQIGRSDPEPDAAEAHGLHRAALMVGVHAA
jgi:hypothetical protein